MVLRDTIVKSESEGHKSMAETEESDDEVEYALEGEALVTRRVLNSQVKDDTEQQRENIFRTRCLINNKVCSMIKVYLSKITHVNNNFELEIRI